MHAAVIITKIKNRNNKCEKVQKLHATEAILKFCADCFAPPFANVHRALQVRFGFVFQHADLGFHSFFRNIQKQNVFDAPGPPGTGAFRASDATSFSAAATDNGPFWTDSAARASNT